MNKQSGFTLVEIAIVMVIIGLLLGGVLKGQEIITNARVKNLESDVTGLTAAIYSYQDRYRAFPGDDRRADRFGDISTCPASGLCGDGDRQIGTVFDSSTDDDESRLFWLHLRNAGLVAGTTGDQEQPSNAFNGLTGVSTGLAITSGATIPGHFVGFTDIPQGVAIIIESRGDDGNPISGNVQGADNGGGAATNYDTDQLYELYVSL